MAAASSSADFGRASAASWAKAILAARRLRVKSSPRFRPNVGAVAALRQPHYSAASDSVAPDLALLALAASARASPVVALGLAAWLRLAFGFGGGAFGFRGCRGFGRGRLARRALAPLLPDLPPDFSARASSSADRLVERDRLRRLVAGQRGVDAVVADVGPVAAVLHHDRAALLRDGRRATCRDRRRSGGPCPASPSSPRSASPRG